MRKIKTIDDITKDGKVEFGEGYEFVSTAEEADAILMRSTDLHGYELPEGIRAIARCGAGVNNIPVEEYAKKGVVVFNSPGANSNAVKELVLGMLVLSSRGVVQSMNWVRDNADDPEIQVDAEKAKKAFVGRELKGKRIGVIGLGNVGSKVANACVDLGMDVYGYDPFISVEHAWVLSREVQRVGTLEDLCRGCDYLTVHVPSKADTIGMISTEQINLLAPDAVLINYARETIIDEDAVDAALRAGKLSWFSCDFATPKTVKMPNTFITTHSGAGTGEAEANCADMAISELKDYLENGNIAHSVNYPACSMGKARAASRIACLHANVPNMIGQITAILAKDNANLKKQVAALRSRINDDAQADFEQANYCASLMRAAWDNSKASYSRLVGEDLESTFQTICGTLNSIMEEASLICRQPPDYDGGDRDE